MCLMHKWNQLGELYLLDAHQFSGGKDFTGCKVRRCEKCGKYQYKNTLWVDCEISGNGKESKTYYLCEEGFRRGKGLKGKVSPTYTGVVEVNPVSE